MREPSEIEIEYCEVCGEPVDYQEWEYNQGACGPCRAEEIELENELEERTSPDREQPDLFGWSDPGRS